MLRQRISGLPTVVIHLTFSPDGQRLAAVLGGGSGLRLYALDSNGRWSQLAADTDYGDHSNGVAFAADGRLATTSYDGRLRLYCRDGSAASAGRDTTPPTARPCLQSGRRPLSGRLRRGA